MSADYEFFTVVFKGDLRKLNKNPFKITDTPFGKPIACGHGDTFTEIESLKIIIDEAAPEIDRLRSLLYEAVLQMESDLRSRGISTGDPTPDSFIGRARGTLGPLLGLEIKP